MTKTCVICKKQHIPFDITRSFHKFPNNPELKAKWMQITGVSAISINSTVCSDHFQPNAFHDTDGYAFLRRLLRNTVPTLTSVKIESGNNLNECQEINDASSESFDKEISSSKVMNCVDASHNTNFQDSCTNTNDMLDTQELLLESTSTNKNCTVEDCMPETSSNNGVNNKRLKRKHPDHISEHNIVNKKFRFKNGVQSYCISREDFVCDESSNKFVKYTITQKHQLAAARQRNFRKKKRINSIKEVVNSLKKKETSVRISAG